MISVQEYLTQHATSWPVGVQMAAERLILAVQTLLADPTCPTPDAGLRSGYRPPLYNENVPGAAPNSKHMTGHAIDLNDNDGELDEWLTDDLLALYKLYREAPPFTKSWCHLQDQPPKSGKRTFNP